MKVRKVYLRQPRSKRPGKEKMRELSMNPNPVSEIEPELLSLPVSDAPEQSRDAGIVYQYRCSGPPRTPP